MSDKIHKNKYENWKNFVRCILTKNIIKERIKLRISKGFNSFQSPIQSPIEQNLLVFDTNGQLLKFEL